MLSHDVMAVGDARLCCNAHKCICLDTELDPQLCKLQVKNPGNLAYIFVCLTTDLRVISCDLSEFVIKHRVWVCVHSYITATFSKQWF